MTLYRVTANLPHGTHNRSHRVCTSISWTNKVEAQKYADETNKHYPRANARVVRDNERVRKMIP